MSSPTETIDALLEHYLALLDEYTTLRDQLNKHQSGMYQSIARANFSAERGIRYGQDYYDERMQAGRRVHIHGSEGADAAGTGAATEAGTEKDTGTTVEAKTIKDSTTNSGHGLTDTASPVFSVRAYPDAATTQPGGKGETTEEPGGADRITESPRSNGTDGTSQDGTTADDRHSHQQQQSEQEERSKQKENPAPTPPTNPLRWFGILTPLPLRQAQSHAVHAVEQIVPRLATVSAEMAAVELAVRRARKRRAKLERAGEREREREREREKTVEAGAVAELGERLGTVDVSSSSVS